MSQHLRTDFFRPNITELRQDRRGQSRKREISKSGFKETNLGTDLANPLFLGKDLTFVSFQNFGQGRILGFFPGDESAPIHFRFNGSRPFFGIEFVVECFILRRVTFTEYLCLPLVGTALANCCHDFAFHKGEKNLTMAQLWQKTFFNSIFFLANGSGIGAGCGIRTHDLQLGKLTLYR